MDVHGAGQPSRPVVDGDPAFADAVAGALEAVAGAATVDSVATDSLGTPAAIDEVVRERGLDGTVAGDTVTEIVNHRGA